MNRFPYIALIAILLIAPFSASAQAGTTTIPTPYLYTRDGIFGCNAGQYGGSPGTTAAIGGIYVPVNDAAVTLNTGVLIYKECILRGVVNRMREQMTAATIKQGTLAFNTGRATTDASGVVRQGPYFPMNLKQDKIAETDRIIALNLTAEGGLKPNGTFASLNSAFQEVVGRAVVRGYYRATRKPNDVLSCPYDDVANALKGNPKDIWDALDAFRNPACSPLSAYFLADQLESARTSSALGDMILKLGWGDGIYDIAAPDENGDMITRTPARFVGSSEEQLLSSGLRQQEMANDVDQMIGSLFASMSTQVLQDNRGLAALTQSTGGQQSYLDKVAAEAAAGFRNAVANTALALLKDAQTVEKVYGDTMRAIASLLISTKNTFAAQELQCWKDIIQKTCATPLKADNTCTAPPEGCTTDPGTGEQVCPPAVTLKVSTSTIYSQAAVAAGASTFNLLPTVQQNVTSSEKAMTLFAQLIAGVMNTTSPSAQNYAIQQFNTLVERKLLHTQRDLDQAEASQKAVQQAVSTLATQISDAWRGNVTAADGTVLSVPWNGTYPPKTGNDIVGWCNVGNDPTIKLWIAKWKK